MYKIGELKFREHVSYTEMMAVAMQYAKNMLGAALDEGAVAYDFMRMSAIMYAFCDMKEETIDANDAMHDVYSYGYTKYIQYIREHTPMGAEYFDAFIRMLDKADETAAKKQPIDKLLDSAIRASDALTELLQPGENGQPAIMEALNAIKEVAGAATGGDAP